MGLIEGVYIKSKCDLFSEVSILCNDASKYGSINVGFYLMFVKLEFSLFCGHPYHPM